MWFGFQFDEPGYVSVMLHNELGQQIATVYQANYESGKEIQQLNVANLAAGNYFLELNFIAKDNNKSTSQTKKFIVIR